MVNTINMQDMRHLNLFAKVTRINTRFSFPYNGAIVFCVPRPMIFRAVGRGAGNIKKLNEILGKKIKIIASPRGIEDAKTFIEDVVKPVAFNGLEINDKEIVIDAGGMQNKAMLLGRNKARLLELQNIVKGFFGKGLRVS